MRRLLGRGAAKSVYLADDLLARRPVALAVLRPEASADPTVGPRFSREARAAAALRSPYVVRVLDVGKTADGTRYLVSEAVLGRGLDQAIERGPAPARAAALWTAEVLAGLAEAHARGVLHRDVKPENVLLAPSPGHPVGEAARLTDFGLAKVLDGSLEGSVMLRTAQGAVMGTADYMPPEQWSGGPVDARSDLYAAGAMLHELLTGRAPFTADSLRGMCAAHMVSEVEPFGADVPDDARPFEAVVRRALEKRPDRRYQSADAMREALEAAGGFRLSPPTFAEPDEDDGPFVRGELVTDAGVGPVQVVAAARAVLGRAGHVVLRCVPFTPDNERRGRTLSRRHARLEWRGGAAVLRDLGSTSGTSVSGRAVDPGSAGVPLRQGDVIALGPHVRLRFEHAPVDAGVLPRWARLTRLDPHGAGLIHLLVLSDADVSGEAGAAVPLPPDRAHGDRLVLVVRGGRFEVVGADGSALVARDGSSWRVGAVTLTFAQESARV